MKCQIFFLLQLQGLFHMVDEMLFEDDLEMVYIHIFYYISEFH